MEARKYTIEEAWKAYEDLPEELKKMIFSLDTAEEILKICERNGIKGRDMSELATQIGYVLLGLFPPDEFREWLEKKYGKEKVKIISHDINRFIFFPVKAELENLYHTEIIKIPKIKGVSPPEKKEDIYREPAE